MFMLQMKTVENQMVRKILLTVTGTAVRWGLVGYFSYFEDH